MNPTDDLILKALSDAASAGERCPTNAEMAVTVGTRNQNQITCALQRLEAAGAIIITRRSSFRDITIARTGKATVSRKRTPSSNVGKRITVKTLPPRPARDACPLCNVRPEFGCRHGWNGEYYERAAA
jgi:hypothetical protein